MSRGKVILTNLERTDMHSLDAELSGVSKSVPLLICTDKMMGNLPTY